MNAINTVSVSVSRFRELVPNFHGLLLALTVWIAQGVLGTGAQALVPNQVLVIYNSADVDSAAVYSYYVSKRPGVLGFDLQDASLNPGAISYSDFVSKVRNPLRAHLAAQGLTTQVVVFVMTKGLPHRIQDINNANVGNGGSSGAAQISAGNATYASVESELTLLWQDLDSGEGGGAMDSKADNGVENPYFNNSQPITSYGRSKIANSKGWQQLSSQRWKMLTKNNGPAATPGDIYLTSRLDGNSVSAVYGMIDRGLIACYDSATDHIIQDSNATGTIDGGDFAVTEIYVGSTWPAFTYEKTNTFLIGQTGDLNAGNSGTQRFTGKVAALTTYGGNHGGNRSVFINTYAGQLCSGAIYNGYESFNAKQFGGVGGYGDQGQLSEWVDVGGTFGVGCAWEPLASGIVKNYAMLKHFLIDGQSWVEAAWSGARYLSWQNVVIGDPLAVASFGNCPDPTPTPTVTISATGALCETSAATATVTVSIDETVSSPTEVGLEFSGAEMGADFTATGGVKSSITIPANQSSVSFDLVAVEDTVPEGEEILTVAVSPGAGYIESPVTASVPIEDSGFGAWQVEQFGASATAPEAAFGADPDGDDNSNLLEYATGSDPNGVASGEQPLMWEEFDQTLQAQVIVFRYRRVLSNDDISYTIEGSSTLGANDWSAVAETSVSTDSQYEWREARVLKSVATRRFLRLSIAFD